ncbi:MULTISPECIES: sucrase ferredoxin [unclassified Ornithinimicrobium]|uniref:sucrase ferredoxin n=1 Tax=unclassified Ornithinimicrobium TaxID=2615080 RepID=UPI0038553C23
MPESSFRCSDAARERQDPLVGTAPPQRRLLLVEQESGWAFDGFASLPVPQDVKDEVRRRVEDAGGRTMLIRRPGRRSSTVCSLRAWCVVDPRARAGSRVTWGTWACPSELLGAVERLEELRDEVDRADTADGAPGPASSTGHDERLVLVCTHGTKDVCCAVRGRPVAVRLAQEWPEETWECTHTGGDRFAANVVLLPDGATYGSLDVDTAPGVVRAHRAGAPDTAHLRGVTGHPRPVQAAVVAVHEQLGPLPWGAVSPRGRVPLVPGPDELAAHRVTLDLADGRAVEVDVREHGRAPVQLTCRTLEPKVSQVPVAGPVRVLP